ncbi:MAG: hypothetical protein E7399_07825 [Ruminococcaceae bacterium]|nr:hypothetical protein [Oscillospiraceae bacterium]
MKRRLLIGVSAFLFIVVMIYIRYEFEYINLSNEPYFSNRKQFQDVFTSNIDRFYELVENGKCCNGMNFQYNMSLGDDQVYSICGNKKFAENMLFLVKNTGMTNFRKTNDDRYFLIYQYAPVFFSDVCIGAKYDYQKENWTYYYQHDYNNCRHKNKIIYRLYDLIYNPNSTLIND